MIEAARASLEERGALLLAIRRAGVRDIAILRAFETTPRETFTPYRYRDLANRNISLPIGCGQTMTRPVDLARRIAALGVEKSHRVLAIGAGSGYGAAILAQLAHEVVAIERYQSLAFEATAHLTALEISNAQIIHADGLAPDPHIGSFDRIFVQAAISSSPAALIPALKPGGALLYARAGTPGRQRLIKLVCNSPGTFEEIDLGPCRLVFSTEGQAQTL